MLVSQGVISIQHWTGVVADAAVMRRKLERLFDLQAQHQS
jgi:shikimate 5-dehydrogenase